MSVRTPQDIVEEYRQRGYSDEKIRIIALSRAEGLRARILEYIEEHPAEDAREGMVQQYLPVRRVDEDSGGAGAVPDEEPSELDEEPAEPMSVPDEAPAEEAPVPRGKKGRQRRKGRATTRATVKAKTRKAKDEEEEEDLEDERVLPVVDEVEQAERAAEEEAVAAGVSQRPSSVEIKELRRRLEEACIEAERAKQAQNRLAGQNDKLSNELADRDEQLGALATREEELLRASEERERLREDADAQSVTVAALESAVRQKEARLEEAAGIHADEMHRIIDAYEQRIKGVRAQGLKGNLIAFASAAVVLLVFLVSLANRPHIDERIVPLPWTYSQDLQEETEEPLDLAPPREEIARQTQQDARESVRQGMSVADGSTFVDQPEQTAFALRQEPPPAVEQQTPLTRENPAQDSAVIRYVVKKNDTLWDISERFLGAGKHYPKIESDNHLRSKKLKVGQKLVIRPAGAQ